jgi:hypothetical protein
VQPSELILVIHNCHVFPPASPGNRQWIEAALLFRRGNVQIVTVLYRTFINVNRYSVNFLKPSGNFTYHQV